ncbi:MAG: hypothetical protein Q4G47_07705, partial [Lachnospiraceae bacterium]|nr:hypothetical protein [Lachnospiraceae bacterium]
GFDDSEVIATASFEPTEPKKEKKSPFEFLKFWKKKEKADDIPAPSFEQQPVTAAAPAPEAAREQEPAEEPVQEEVQEQDTASEQESSGAEQDEAQDDAVASSGTIQDEVIRTADAQEAQYHPLDDDPFSSEPTKDASMPGVSFDADGAKDDVVSTSDENYADSSETEVSGRDSTADEDAGDDNYYRYTSYDEPLD